MNASPAPISDLAVLLRSLEPQLHDGTYVYASLPPGAPLPAGLDALATFREAEGLTVVAEEGAALAAGLTPLFRAAWITLTVHSDLAAIGLTAAFARALGDAGVSCNVVAAAQHDHVFVPVERADDAIAALRALQRGGAGDGAAIFATPRLRGRRLVPADVDALLEVYGDAEAMRWVGDGQPLDRAACERWIDVTLRNYATRGYGMFALVDRAGEGSDAVIGFAGLVHPGGQREAELKYALRRASWGRGLATEAAAALLACGAARFGLERVIATAYPDNLASHRVLEKAGMRRGELRREDDGSDTQLFEWTA